MIRSAVSGAVLAMVACAVPVRAQQAAGEDTGWGLTVAQQRYFNDRIMPYLRYS